MANKLLKPKRGRVENLPKLAVEDGSLIFAYDTKSPTSTVLVDVGETRYELSAATAKKADDSSALGGSSLQNIVDKINNATGDGTAFTGLDTTTNNKVKLTRANGTTVEKTVDNVSHASTTDLAKNSNALGGSSLKNITDKIDSSIAANDAMHYMGTIGATAQKPTTTALPATARTGDAYKVITAGTYSSIAAEVGDLFIYSGSWTLIPSGDDGNVYVGDSKSSKFAAKSNNIVVAVGDQKVASAANVTANAGTISALQSTLTQLKANQGTVTTLSGNKATFTTFVGRLNGDSDATYFVRSADTRLVNTLPSTYTSTYGMGSKEEFKDNKVIGLTGANGYSHVITHIPWRDSTGGRPFQVAYSGTKMFIRGAANDSAWDDWHKVITGADALASSASAIGSTNNYFTAGATTALIAAKTASVVGNYLPLSGGTLTGKLQVNDVIFGYRYSSNNDSPAFVFDKPGDHYTGIGAHGTDTIYFSAVNTSGLTWNHDYKQKWVFNGSVSATTVTADCFDGTIANATSAENASHLGGKVASDYALKADLSGDINALSAKRLPSYQSISVANSFFYRYGVVGNTSDGGAWTGFPSATLYNAASTVNGFGNALFQKKVGVLHLASGSSAHDLVFQAGGTNGGIAYVATGRDPAYILDTLNYKDKAYTFNKLTASSTFTATSGVVIDGGSY